MNLLNKYLISKNVKIKKSKNNTEIINETNSTGFIILKKSYWKQKNTNMLINFSISNLSGSIPQIKLINRKASIIKTINPNEETVINIESNFFMLGIKIPASSSFIINKLEVISNYSDKIIDNFKNDILVISPGYPSFSNKYSFGFVHTRLLEYKKNNINFDVAILHDDDYFAKYNFENIDVNKINYSDLRNLLLTKHYKKIIIHFFNVQIAQILDAVDKTNTDIYLFFHGTDAAYRDMNILTARYFESVLDYSQEEILNFDERDKILKRYNEMPNVKMIFGTEWIKKHSEEQNNIKFKNYKIIPTYIDNELFKFSHSKDKIRNKIFVLRKFDNISTYSIDINVLTILELSRRKIFSNLEFDLYGEGNYFDELVSPLRKFANVHIYNKFLSHSEISQMHKEHGIGLFATRYETMGVSAAEAAASGCAVVTNSVAAVNEVFDNSKLLCEENDFVQMANIIEKLVTDKNYYEEERKKQYDSIVKKYNYNATIQKELDLISIEMPKPKISISSISEEPLLTVAIASYNVEKYLVNSVFSLLKSKYVKDLEILIINDGSKDNTSIIGKKLEKMTYHDGKSIVKLIDKENGGHGSAINKGIELARGKYFKLMDGDDYFDTQQFDILIEKLKKENSDIVLNNYVEDLSIECKLNPVKYYDFMVPGKQYNINDLCNKIYGFKNFGPLLSTSTFKTKMLKDLNIKISENCFYVDMELNSFAFSVANTVTYYPLNIYIYYLGRTGQSVSAASFKKNYKNHENVTLRIINDIYYSFDLTEEKKNYLKNNIILPLINTQYLITIYYFNNSRPFVEFNRNLKKFPEFYNDKKAIDKSMRKYRIFYGMFFRLFKLLSKIKGMIFR